MAATMAAGVVLMETDTTPFPNDEGGDKGGNTTNNEMVLDFDELDRVLAEKEKKMAMLQKVPYQQDPYGYVHPLVAGAAFGAQ